MDQNLKDIQPNAVESANNILPKALWDIHYQNMLELDSLQKTLLLPVSNVESDTTKTILHRSVDPSFLKSN